MARVVLGYSGLDGSAEHLLLNPDLVGFERRIFQGMDAAAALFVDGKLVAAVQEERFSGTKFDHRFPTNAIAWCLADAGIDEAEVETVAHGFDFEPYRRLMTSNARSANRFAAVYARERQEELIRRHFPQLAVSAEFQTVRHHDAHALSAAHASGFDECITLVMDGMGELDAISVFHWNNKSLRRLASLDIRSSLGLFYSLVTMHLGLQPNSDEYRLMALAAYGDPDRYAALMSEAVELRPNGRVVVPLLRSEPDDPFREQYRSGRTSLTNGSFPPLSEGCEFLAPHADLAAACQQRLEDAISHVLDHWMRVTGLRRVAFAGGVALNCVANGKLLARGVEALYVQPAAGDEGSALGAALGALGPEADVDIPSVPYFGPQIDTKPSDGRPYTHVADDRSAADLAAELLARGAVVGWARGRLEFGPRALGNRSILADPRDIAMRDRVNSTVKFREGFRPLAPAVTPERAREYFEIAQGTEPRHMTVAVPVRSQKRDSIAAVVHVDGTARVQVVDRSANPAFAAVIDRFEARTGVPVLLNTSLNVKGQPMACSAEQALWTFDKSKLDALFIGNTVVSRGPWDTVVEGWDRP